MANAVGIAVYLTAAVQTWSIDFALGGLFWQVLVMNIDAALFAVINLIWLISVLLRNRSNRLSGLLTVWGFTVTLWLATIGFDLSVSERLMREVKELLR